MFDSLKILIHKRNRNRKSMAKVRMEYPIGLPMATYLT